MAASPAFDLRSGSGVKGALLVRVVVDESQPFAEPLDVLDGFLVDHLLQSVSDALHAASRLATALAAGSSAPVQRGSQTRRENEHYQVALLGEAEGSQRSVLALSDGVPLVLPPAPAFAS